MAVPTTYTEAELKTYMDVAIGAVADALAWTVVGGQYDEPVNATLLHYGTTDISTISGITNTLKLRALARREVWRAAWAEVSADFDFENEASKVARSKVHDQIGKNFILATTEAMEYDPLYVVSSKNVVFNDPYVPIDEDDL